MVQFRPTAREIVAKIVYYGPPLGGKTTNLRMLWEGYPPEVRGELIVLPTGTDRTIYFDYLPLTFRKLRGLDLKIQLYTVPGQVRFDSTRQVVLRGVDGVVFVADSQREVLASNLESWANLKKNLALQGLFLPQLPHVIQYNKRDLPNIVSVEELDGELNEFNAPIFEAIAIQGIGVEETLQAIVRLVVRSLRDRFNLPLEPQPAAASPPRTEELVTKPVEVQPQPLPREESWERDVVRPFPLTPPEVTPPTVPVLSDALETSPKPQAIPAEPVGAQPFFTPPEPPSQPLAAEVEPFAGEPTSAAAGGELELAFVPTQAEPAATPDSPLAEGVAKENMRTETAPGETSAGELVLEEPWEAPLPPQEVAFLEEEMPSSSAPGRWGEVPLPPAAVTTPAAPVFTSPEEGKQPPRFGEQGAEVAQTAAAVWAQTPASQPALDLEPAGPPAVEEPFTLPTSPAAPAPSPLAEGKTAGAALPEPFPMLVEAELAGEDVFALTPAPPPVTKMEAALVERVLPKAVTRHGELRELEVEVPVPAAWIGGRRVTLQLRLTLVPEEESHES